VRATNARGSSTPRAGACVKAAIASATRSSQNLPIAILPARNQRPSAAKFKPPPTPTSS